MIIVVLLVISFPAY
ncbi:type I toxin-antitoxin system Ibs family toxin [Escherichia coli]|nr:type I toxin-antitoxin system Ibs family toxin [Escherichia coli]MCN4954898.1 type I toxin-antitoxin system Ibs family toxin [Escherichia coli]MCN6738762.1 type I toxin-antitoxin system Ibs family toxin [Escherichia coli]MDO8101277.1 type I toxin-antitoxin system Ibs family toxin [Escherichia coli]MDS1569963.1 type I toxin-antitoxin system Ibs family toxin [Escherichia coli]MDZ3966880.1 type I toxin-antitoxin system Ibs family toxin [Escherichia coli]